MLCKRIIPTILIRNGLVVKDKCWNPTRVVGTIPQVVNLFNKRGADELLVMNLGEYDSSLVANIATNNFIPLTYVGGIDSVEKAVSAIKNGADKVGITWSGSREIYKDVAERLGRQSVVCVTKTPFAPYVDEWAGEFVIQDKYRDGTMGGYRVPFLIETTANIIWSSGCSSPDDAKKIIKFVDGVGISSLFFFTDHTPKTIKDYIGDYVCLRQ